MSRSDQWIGLNPWALEFLRRHAVSDENLDPVEGAWMSVVGHTKRYRLQDGSSVDSFVQSVPWQSGPMYFLALKRTDGEVIAETLWTETELDGDGRFHEWTPERAYLEALEPTAFEAGRYLLALLRRDEIGAAVYAQLLDNCLYGLDYHEREAGMPFTAAEGSLESDYAQLLIRIAVLARCLRQQNEWPSSDIEDIFDLTNALGIALSQWAHVKQQERAEMFAGNIDS